jgi:hypothetical protein
MLSKAKHRGGGLCESDGHAMGVHSIFLDCFQRARYVTTQRISGH